MRCSRFFAAALVACSCSGLLLTLAEANEHVPTRERQLRQQRVVSHHERNLGTGNWMKTVDSHSDSSRTTKSSDSGKGSKKGTGDSQSKSKKLKKKKKNINKSMKTKKKQRTSAPSAAPSGFPSSSPTAAPTPDPTAAPTATPTMAPTDEPTKRPTGAPSGAPTDAPTREPTPAPSRRPVAAPTEEPTRLPTSRSPTRSSTRSPVETPTTRSPTQSPTRSPIVAEVIPPSTDAPVQVPTTRSPTRAPTRQPVVGDPTEDPTRPPTTLAPTRQPVVAAAPTTSNPTREPTTRSPSRAPVMAPIAPPTDPDFIFVDAASFCVTYESTMGPTTTAIAEVVSDATCNYIAQNVIRPLPGASGFTCAYVTTSPLDTTPLQLSYTLTSVFVDGDDVPSIPTSSELSTFVMEGFMSSGVDTLVTTLGGFADTNPFSATTGVAYTEGECPEISSDPDFIFVDAASFCVTYESTMGPSSTAIAEAVSDTTCNYIAQNVIRPLPGASGFTCAYVTTSPLDTTPLQLFYTLTSVFVDGDDVPSIPTSSELSTFVMEGFMSSGVDTLVTTLGDFADTNPFSATTGVAYTEGECPEISSDPDFIFVDATPFCVTYESTTGPTTTAVAEAVSDTTCNYIAQNVIRPLPGASGFTCSYVTTSPLNTTPLQLSYTLTSIFVDGDDVPSIPTSADMDAFVVAGFTSPDALVTSLGTFAATNPFSTTTGVSYKQDECPAPPIGNFIPPIAPAVAPTESPVAALIFVDSNEIVVAYVSTVGPATDTDLAVASDVTCGFVARTVVRPLGAAGYTCDWEPSSTNVDGGPIAIVYVVTAIYRTDDGSEGVLSQAELDAALRSGLTSNDNSDTLLSSLSALAASNAFSSTTAVTVA